MRPGFSAASYPAWPNRTVPPHPVATTVAAGNGPGIGDTSMNRIHPRGIAIATALSSVRLSIWSRIRLTLALVLLSLGPLPSAAMPLTWSLDNVTFTDGGVATGSFSYDADTSSLVDWNISVSGGDETTFPAFSYTPATIPDTGVFDTGPGLSFQFFVDTFALGGTPESRVLALSTLAPLTDVGGTVALQIGNDPSWESRECYNCNPYRLVATGSIRSAVPEPSSLVILATGLILLSVMSRARL